MIDVKLIFNATFEEVSRSVSGRGAGGFVGALIGGILIDRFGHSLDFVVGVCETAAAVAIAFLPFSPSISTVWIHYFTIGFTASIINMGKKTLFILLGKLNIEIAMFWISSVLFIHKIASGPVFLNTFVF